MSERNRLGEIVIDPMRTGFKVTSRLFHPETGKPEIVGTDQFPNYPHARFFAGKLSEAMDVEIVDKTGGAR